MLQRCVTLERELSQQSSENSGLKATIVGMERQHAAVVRECSELADSLSGMSAKIGELDSKAAQLDVTQRTLAQLEQELKARSESLAEAQALVVDTQAKIMTLEVDAQAKAIGHEQLVSENERLQRRLSLVQHDTASLAERFAAEQARARGAEHVASELEQHKHRLQAKQEEATQLSEQLAAEQLRAAEVHRLGLDRDALQSRLDASEAKHVNLHQEMTQLAERLANEHRRAQQCEALVSEHEAGRQALASEHKAVQQRLAGTQAELDELREASDRRTAAMEATARELIDKCDALERSEAHRRQQGMLAEESFNRQLAEANDNSAALQLQLNHQNQQLQQRSSELEWLATSHRELQRASLEAASSKAEIESIAARNTALLEQIKQMDEMHGIDRKAWEENAEEFGREVARREDEMRTVRAALQKHKSDAAVMMGMEAEAALLAHKLQEMEQELSKAQDKERSGRHEISRLTMRCDTLESEELRKCAIGLELKERECESLRNQLIDLEAAKACQLQLAIEAERRELARSTLDAIGRLEAERDEAVRSKRRDAEQVKGLVIQVERMQREIDSGLQREAKLEGVSKRLASDRNTYQQQLEACNSPSVLDQRQSTIQ